MRQSASITQMLVPVSSWHKLTANPQQYWKLQTEQSVCTVEKLRNFQAAPFSRPAAHLCSGFVDMLLASNRKLRSEWHALYQTLPSSSFFPACPQRCAVDNFLLHLLAAAAPCLHAAPGGEGTWLSGVEVVKI